MNCYYQDNDVLPSSTPATVVDVSGRCEFTCGSTAVFLATDATFTFFDLRSTLETIGRLSASGDILVFGLNDDPKTG